MDIPSKDIKEAVGPIGEVFTPLEWARFAALRFGIYERWIKGATVFDPTMGIGNLLEALILIGIDKGIPLSELPVHNLYGNELKPEFYNQAVIRFRDKYSLDMHSNFACADILEYPPRAFDVIFGNPPWINFTDLPHRYKQNVKARFFEYGLATDKKSLLLGGARIEFAALIVNRVISDFLHPHGSAFLFLPLSIFFNDGANARFRTFRVNQTVYAPTQIIDLSQTRAFERVATHYGLVAFIRDHKVQFPIAFVRKEANRETAFLAEPALNDTDPLVVFKPQDGNPLKDFKPIYVKITSKPRQGINTGGLNDVFFFNSMNKTAKGQCLVNQNTFLPEGCLYPLITSKNFKEKDPVPGKWVLLPYRPIGKPFSIAEVQAHPSLYRYLMAHKKKLQARKGVLMASQLKRDRWWGLLGVGNYCFAPYKVVWEAYGRKKFKPVIFEGHWRVNQSLQAYMPVETHREAKRI